MTKVQQTIDLFNTLYIVCLVLFIVLLLVSVVLFIKFDIKNIFNVLTGRSVKKTIKEMNEQNEKTGQLRRTPMQPAMSRKLGKQSGQLQGRAPVITPPPSQPVYEEGSNATTVLQQNDAGASETTVLENTGSGNFETTVLNQRDDSNKTDTLETATNEYSMETAQREVDEQYGLFKITYSELHIHTNEVV